MPQQRVHRLESQRWGNQGQVPAPQQGGWWSDYQRFGGGRAGGFMIGRGKQTDFEARNRAVYRKGDGSTTGNSPESISESVVSIGEGV